jgi:hypothetical protein
MPLSCGNCGRSISPAPCRGRRTSRVRRLRCNHSKRRSASRLDRYATHISTEKLEATHLIGRPTPRSPEVDAPRDHLGRYAQDG